MELLVFMSMTSVNSAEYVGNSVIHSNLEPVPGEPTESQQCGRYTPEYDCRARSPHRDAFKLLST